jgi:hypothetical protein
VRLTTILPDRHTPQGKKRLSSTVFLLEKIGEIYYIKSIMNNLFVIIWVILGFLVVLTGLLLFYFFTLKKRIDLFFKNGEKNLEEFLTNKIGKLEKQEGDIKKIFEEISRLNIISEKSFQKIGLVRYNPFKDVGGDQSFSIALLDLNNNGFVFTNLYQRDGNRTYAKSIENGQSQYSLSEEEKEAIDKATGKILNSQVKDSNKNNNRNGKKR